MATDISEAGWTTVFFDGFDGSDLDRAKWSNVYDGATYWNGAFAWESDQVSVGNGNLTIGMQNTGDGFWEAGAVATLDQGSNGFDFTYGRVEIRSKTSVEVVGAGPCFLLWPATDDHWPPEVDILETPASGDGMFTNHWQGPGGNNDDVYESFFFELDHSQWHTYTLDWTPDSLTLYIDGEHVYTTTENIPHEAMSIALQGHVGRSDDGWYGSPNGSGVDRVDVEVDYVKVSQYTGEGEAPAPSQPEPQPEPEAPAPEPQPEPEQPEVEQPELEEPEVEQPEVEEPEVELPEPAPAPELSAVQHGTAGSDWMVGNDAGDFLWAWEGIDDLQGGAGDDTLIGGTGNDGLTLGEGADTVVFSQGDGADWVVDFTSGTDRIELYGITAEQVTTAQDMRCGKVGLAVDLGNGDELFLQGVSALTTQDLVFA